MLPYAGCLPSILSSYILPRNPQVYFRSNKLLNSTVSCELVSNFISLYPRISRDLKQLHSMLGGNVIQCLLALLYQWGRCFGRMKGFQSRLIVRANTNVFLWPSICLNFIRTGQDRIYFGLESFNIRRLCVFLQCIFVFCAVLRINGN